MQLATHGANEELTKSSLCIGRVGHVCLNINFQQNFPYVTHNFANMDKKIKIA